MPIHLGPAPGLTIQDCINMGFTPPPMPRVSRPAPWPDFRTAAKAEWNRKEAIRELECFLADKPYTYCPPREEWFHPGVGYLVPPTGGSAVQKANKQ